MFYLTLFYFCYFDEACLYVNHKTFSNYNPSQVIDLYHPLALRLFLIGTHYRSPINYSNAQLETASDRLYYIFQVMYCTCPLWTKCILFFPTISFQRLQTLHDCEEILRHNSERNFEDSVPKETLDCIARFHSEFEI